MLKYWIWLQLVLGPAHTFAGEILHRGYEPRQLFEERLSDSRWPPKLRKRAATVPLAAAQKVIDRCDELKVSVVTPDAAAYPERLYHLASPPLVLYYRGELPCFDALPCLTIVGPRKVDAYGYKCAYSLAARFSLMGFVIVSGGAVGSDYAAHDGTLVHGGKTVAVLGNGFGAAYLAQNEPLRQRIAQAGCLLTELPPDTPASRYTFPARNRLMAALGLGTIVVEAPAKSGALITASYATEQGREVFVIPGRPGDAAYEGSNALLRDGAKPLLDLSDVITEYVREYADRLDIEKGCATRLTPPVVSLPVKKKRREKTSQELPAGPFPVHQSEETAEKSQKDEKSLLESLSKTAKMVYNQLDRGVFVCDEVATALGELELFGLIKSLPGGRFVRS